MDGCEWKSNPLHHLFKSLKKLTMEASQFSICWTPAIQDITNSFRLLISLSLSAKLNCTNEQISRLKVCNLMSITIFEDFHTIFDDFRTIFYDFRLSFLFLRVVVWS